MELPILILLLALTSLTTAFPTTSSLLLSTNSDAFLLNTQTDQPLKGYRTCPGECRAPTGCCVYLGGLWYCGICDKKDESPDKIGKVIDDILPELDDERDSL
jgi:hypothetical protein